MKRFAAASLALLILTLPLAGCHGPQKLSRSLDEWSNDRYVDSPWLVGNMLTHLVLTAATAVTWTADSFINIYYFWVDDAKPFGTGKGTAYPFKAVTPTKK